MYREVLIVIVILIIICFGNFTVTNGLKDSSNILIDKIEEINNTIDNIEQAKELICNLSDNWEKISEDWAIIVTHQELDQIEISLLSARIAIENDNFDDAKIELGKLKFLLEHINEKEAFKLKNIF